MGSEMILVFSKSFWFGVWSRKCVASDVEKSIVEIIVASPSSKLEERVRRMISGLDLWCETELDV